MEGDNARVLVIEDDILWSMKVEQMIENSNYKLLGSANTIYKAIAMIDGLKPDIIISDIKLQDEDIFSVKTDIPIIIMTSHLNEQMFQLSKTFPYSTFLAKPFHEYTLFSTIELLISKYPKSKQTEGKHIEVRGKHQQIKKLMLDEIVWIQGKGNYAFIQTKDNKTYVKKKTLAQLSPELSEDTFIKIHKGYIINTEYIQRVDLGHRIILVKDAIIPIGRVYRKALDPYLSQKD